MKINIAGIVYDAGNSEIRKTGSWRIFKPIVTEKCNACGLCVQFCPEAAITLKNKAVIDYDFCKGCLICLKECPAKAVEKELEKK